MPRYITDRRSFHENPPVLKSFLQEIVVKRNRARLAIGCSSQFPLQPTQSGGIFFP